MTASGAHLDTAAARRALEELRQLEREIVELGLLRRRDALERVRDAVARIGEVGSPEGILDRAAEELGTGSALDRVLISQVRDDLLVPHAMWVRGDRAAAEAALAQLARDPVRLEYPLIEHEIALGQRATIVAMGTSRARSPRRFAEVLSWSSYVVAALTLRGTTVGLLHADAGASHRAVDAVDREVASLYADGLAGAFERAALRKTLQRHREELRAAIRWMSGRLGGADTIPLTLPAATDAKVDALTEREVQVLRLLVRGRTNLSIAKTLVISEGTVKYHVKNILRKLQATGRADAVARYLRSTG
jgi:DNA-binding CsgD family transcriptional regulator